MTVAQEARSPSVNSLLLSAKSTSWSMNLSVGAQRPRRGIITVGHFDKSQARLSDAMIRNSGRIQLALCIVVLLLWGAVVAPVAAQSSEEQALEAVREEIRALERRVVQQHVERDTGYRALRSSELAISASTS